MAAAVVDRLEVVHVGHDEADLLALAFGAKQFALQNVEDGFAVPQAGERVARGFAAEGILRLHQPMLRHQQTRAGAHEGEEYDCGRQHQVLARDLQRHRQHDQRVEQVKQLGVNLLLRFGRVQRSMGRLSLLPGER